MFRSTSARNPLIAEGSEPCIPVERRSDRAAHPDRHHIAIDGVHDVDALGAHVADEPFDGRANGAQRAAISRPGKARFAAHGGAEGVGRVADEAGHVDTHDGARRHDTDTALMDHNRRCIGGDKLIEHVFVIGALRGVHGSGEARHQLALTVANHAMVLFTAPVTRSRTLPPDAVNVAPQAAWSSALRVLFWPTIRAVPPVLITPAWMP